MFKEIILLTLALFFFLQEVEAMPLFAGPTPQNNSYIYGRNTDVFSVNISEENLDNSTVKLHAKVEDPTSVWTNMTMNCFLISSANWSCNSTIPNLQALVHDGNWLLYYFDAYDTSGNYGNLSNSSNSFRVRIDRSPPEVNFISPKNESFSSDSPIISIDVIDTYSEVNASNVNYSFDNSTWLTMTTTDKKVFTSVEKWNTTIYQNNQTVSLYAKASDVLSNDAYLKITSTIDNELPRVIIIKPQPNQTLSDSFVLELRVEDTYSGLDFQSVKYNFTDIKNVEGGFSCSDDNHTATCTATLMTKSIRDGYHQLVFKTLDKAKNERTNSTSIIIDNLPPKITILSPTSASTVSGNVNVSALVKDDGVGVANVSFRIESGGASGNWEKMNCVADYCSTMWNSANVTDGTYTVRVYSMDKIGRSTSMVVQIGVVNQQGAQIRQTTTTSPPTTESPLSQTISKLMNLPLLIVFILSIIFLSIFIYLVRKGKSSKKAPTFEMGDVVGEYMRDFDNIQNVISTSLASQDIDNMKDKARLVIVYLKNLEKDFMKMTIEETLRSIENEAIVDGLKKYFKEKEEEMKNIQGFKKEYLDEISKLFNEVLREEDINLAHKNLENAGKLMIKLKNLIDRETTILTEGLNRMNI